MSCGRLPLVSPGTQIIQDRWFTGRMLCVMKPQSIVAFHSIPSWVGPAFSYFMALALSSEMVLVGVQE